MAPKPAEEEAPRGETLKYQTWVLKVLIHCDGCTKRVKKILQGIDGVYTTEIDPRQHKVIVTGNVDAETLIRRLTRSGKSVELWPELPAEKKDKKLEKSKGGDTKNKEKENQKNSEPVGDGGSNEDCIDAAGEDSDHCDDDVCGDASGSGGGGEGGKKKKKKKKKKNKGENGGSAPPNNGGGKEISTVDAPVPQSIVATPKDLITGPPIQHVYPYPHMYYSPPPPPAPAYGLSYNTSYPVSSASYSVGAPMVMPMHAYSAAYPPLPPPPPPSDPIKHYGDDDDDEYQGGFCSIM
ncbi:heavy metal-associated isoprenylated plant protein 36-like [Lotus japonicus]|uniref:HMA domain-containing protein n=1 Tax=Lotus japonicus TaxID=34305 RepID=I3T306_LOTJA|nr:heavy metal-associated isoprenylated plant protein 36-like [Lotus japonicus]AFK46898.1 unknown [Lotus japonicus]